MPAHITLSDLSWSTPDGRTLFSRLYLRFDKARSGLVGRNGVGKTTLLHLIAGVLSPATGIVSVDGTLGLLRQTVKLHETETIASLFDVNDDLDLLLRAERGLAGSDELSRADWTLEARLEAALAHVGLDASTETRLTSLSGGQRTRAALAALVFAAPDFILLDEPTNNLDRVGRSAVIDLLAAWRGGAIVVSHDRELLETMDVIVELTTLSATRYGGNWSHYRERKALELAAARHDLSEAERRIASIEKTALVSTERKARKDRAGRKKRRRGDQPTILLDKMKERSEKTTGKTARLTDRRRAQAVNDAAAALERIEVQRPFTADIPSTGLPPGKTVLVIDSVSAGYRRDHPILVDLSLTVTGPERIAVTGPNGAGKTTLLKLITGDLHPWSGRVRPMTDFAVMDQQMSLLDASASIKENYRRLNPDANENSCYAALARFMFRADDTCQTVSNLSGGQVLRAGLACILGGDRPPTALILDEPTNHLDVSSIETIEAGLGMYDGALFVVSHDEAFLGAIGITRRIDLGDGHSHDPP